MADVSGCIGDEFGRVLREMLADNKRLGELEQRCKELTAEVERLGRELETERLRVVACSTAALMDTERTVRSRIGPDNPYYSASYGDVCRQIDALMKLRTQKESDDHLIEALKGDQIALERANRALKESNDRLRAEVYRLGVAGGFIVPMNAGGSK